MPPHFFVDGQLYVCAGFVPFCTLIDLTAISVSILSCFCKSLGFFHHLDSCMSFETAGRCDEASMGCWPASHQHRASRVLPCCIFSPGTPTPRHGYPSTNLSIRFLCTSFDLDFWCSDKKTNILNYLFFAWLIPHTPLQSRGRVKGRSQEQKKRRKIQTN